MGRDTLIRKVTDTIVEHDLLRPGDHVLVAVSGGADSVALLAALDTLRETWSLRLTVWHLDHGLRGVESARDRGFVEDLAGRLGHAITVEHATIRPGHNLEARARDVRYQMLERAARAAGCRRIAVAHTQTDQAETVALRLLRGAGARGLSAMAPRRGAIIRPLLACSREDVLRFLHARGLSWVEDTSNRDERFTRNRVRRRLLPALAAFGGPRLPEMLARTAALLREDERFLDAVARRRLGRSRRARELPTERVRRLAPAIRARALRLWLASARGSLRGIGWSHIHLLEKHLASTESGTIALPGGVVRYEGGALRWEAGVPARLPPFSHPIALGGRISRPDLGWELDVSGPTRWSGILPADAWTAVFDRHSLPGGLTVRAARPGDRLRPLGLRGHQKLHDIFVNAKVGRSRRSSWPVLAAGDTVLWVPGLARSDTAIVGANTRDIVWAACRFLAGHCCSRGVREVACQQSAEPGAETGRRSSDRRRVPEATPPRRERTGPPQRPRIGAHSG
jgi:tRNA(Ile)-lysidine synthase